MRLVREAVASAEHLPCLRAFAAELDFVYRSLRRHGVQAADVEDLTQEVFLIVWRRWGEYEAERPLRPWLAGIVYKVAHRHVSRRHRFSPEQPPELSDPRPGQDEQLAAARASALVLNALDGLSPAQRAVVVMHDLDGLPMRQVAALQAVPLFTAYTRLRAGRRKLARTVAALGAPGAGDGRRRATLPALFALERDALALPPQLRDRLLARAREARPPGPDTNEAGPPPAERGASRLPLALVGGLAGSLVALVLVVGLRGPPRAGGPPAAQRRVPSSPTPAQGARTAAATRSVPPLLATAPRPAARPPEPIGRWSFDGPRDGAGGGAVRDQSDNGHDCRIRQRNPEGAAASDVWTDGVAGRALALDGRRWLECPAFDRPGRLAGDLTISLWMRAAPGVGAKQVLVTRQLGKTGDRLFSLRLQGGDVELLSHVWQRVLRRPYGRTGQWTHVAAVRDSGTTSLYLDGVLAGRNHPPAAHRALDGAGAPLLIGGQVNGPEIGSSAQQLFHGDLDELAIYDRALGAEEIRALATRLAPPAAGARAPD